MSDIYLIGSLRNPSIPHFAAAMRARGADVFDDWYAAGEHADDAWRDYERARGRDAVSALEGAAARHVFNFDKTHLDAAAAAVLLMPAGTSGHLELGYMLGCGKPGYIVLDGEPERYDVMRCFCTRVFRSMDEFLDGYRVSGCARCNPERLGERLTEALGKAERATAELAAAQANADRLRCLAKDACDEAADAALLRGDTDSIRRIENIMGEVNRG